MCQCKTTPRGVIVCDECAAAQVEALNGLLGDQNTAELPGILTPGEYNGLKSVVNGYFDLLEKEAR
jgi:hypothetical protein